ncbi:hypothetical protein GCM10020367_59160 [Streptomyces sannanensis]|uniref:Nucleopolyhedrovirus P10 family protein n=1 Tax=Streptomyces sannanensis TaxID=285536 RepID=A0ABP6SK14_9ACTN
MATDGWTPAVRQHIGLGRLLPLGGPEDGAWITERAAGGVLSRAASGVPGIRLGTVRIRLADPEAAPEPSVPAPWTALPPGPLRIETEFSAPARQPLPVSAEQLRQALLAAAHERLGLVTAEVDLHVTDLLEDLTSVAEAEAERPAPVAAADTGASHVAASGPLPPSPGPVPLRKPAAELAEAAAAVVGVTRLAPVSGLPMPQTQRGAHPIRIRDSNDPPGRHVQIELATAENHRALDVALAVRTAVTAAARADAPGPVTVAVLVTAVEPAGGP